MGHDSIGRVADDLLAAVRAYRSARDGVPVAQERARELVAAARARAERARLDLAAAIVRAAQRGVRQREIVEATGYNRERVRQILRAAGVEAD